MSSQRFEEERKPEKKKKKKNIDVRRRTQPSLRDEFVPHVVGVYSKD